MKLHAILSWYDESPTWLAGCVASLSRAGVQHVVAVDGRYAHFAIGENVRSAIEQVDAITTTAEAIGIGLTLHRPTHAMTEAEKRTLCFRLVEASATAFEDWVLVIDADELVDTHALDLPGELASLDPGVHVAACRVAGTMDPHAPIAADNEITTQTERMHQKLVIPSRFTQMQSRVWRVMRDMHCRTTHYNYVGTDAAGVVWNLRPDIGGDVVRDLPLAELHRLDSPMELVHRKNHRTAMRQQIKREYYQLRDSIGLERPN